MELSFASPIRQVSASKYHTIALNDAGECFVWGFGKGGRLGTGTEFEYVHFFKPDSSAAQLTNLASAATWSQREFLRYLIFQLARWRRAKTIRWRCPARDKYSRGVPIALGNLATMPRR